MSTSVNHQLRLLRAQPSYRGPGGRTPGPVEDLLPAVLGPERLHEAHGRRAARHRKELASLTPALPQKMRQYHRYCGK
jgi:hypothetical protein